MNNQDYINRLSKDNISIFLFHGVIKKNLYKVRNYNRKHILENEFYSLLKDLRTIGAPLSMDECYQHILNAVPFPKNSFVITFDDGFENNSSVAAPILEDLKIPSIFYITTGFIENNWMSWVDQIDYAIENTNRKSIELSFLDGEFKISSVEEKISFLKMFRGFAKENKNFFSNKVYFINEIFDVCDVEYISSHSSEIDLKMNWEQVIKLDSSPLFDIGAHTHSHPVMTFISDEECKQEIDISINKLGKKLGKSIRHFSYPEGLSHCFNENIIEYLKEKKILVSPTAVDGVNSLTTDLFHLKRITVV